MQKNMADPGLQFDYNQSTITKTAHGVKPFSDKNVLQSWYGQATTPSGPSSTAYGSNQTERGGLAEPSPNLLSGAMSVTGYQGIYSAPSSISTGLQDHLSTQPGLVSGIIERSPAPSYSGRHGGLADFHRTGPEGRVGFSFSQKNAPDYNKGTLCLPRGITSGSMDTFLPSQYNCHNEWPSSVLRDRSPSGHKSYKDFEYSQDYENPRDLEYMGYETPEELNKRKALEENEDNEDLEGLGDFMLNRYNIPSRQDKPSKARGFSSRPGGKILNERRLGGPSDPSIPPQERSTLPRSSYQAYRGNASSLRRSSLQSSLSRNQEHHSVHPSSSYGSVPPLEAFSDSSHFRPFHDNTGAAPLSRSSERFDEAPFFSAPRGSERLDEAPSFSASRGLAPVAPSPVGQWPDRYGPPSTIPAPYSEPMLPRSFHDESDPEHFDQWKSQSVSTSRLPLPVLSVLRGTRSTDLCPPFSPSGQSKQDPPARIWDKIDLTCVRIQCNTRTPKERDEKPTVHFRQNFRSRTPSSSRPKNEYSRGHTRRSRSPLPFQPQKPSEGLDRRSRSPRSSSRYRPSHPRNRRSRSRSERRSRQHYRDRGRSPPRYHSRGRSAHRSHARSRSPHKKLSPERLDRQKHSRNRSCPRATSKGRSRSRHHSPFGTRYRRSRSPRSKRNSPLRRNVNSKTSSKTRSRSPETRARKSRGRSPSRSHYSQNETKTTKGRSSMSPSNKLSTVNGMKNTSPPRSMSERNLVPSEDISHSGVNQSQSLSEGPWLSSDHPEHVQNTALFSSLKGTGLWPLAEYLDGQAENVKSPSGPRQHFGVLVRPFPLISSNKDISYETFRIFKTFGRVTSLEIHNTGEDRFCLVFYYDSDGQKCALNESQKLELFKQTVSVTAWDGPETESKVVFRPVFREKGQLFDKKATKTLLIRNLDARMDRGDICLRFQAFGKILEITMKKKLDDRGCYAFVQYSDASSVTKAIKEMDGMLIGDYRVKLSYGNTEPTDCMWIDGLKAVPEKVLFQQFNRLVPVLKVAIDKVNSKALVFFAEVEDAKKALNLSKGKKLCGCPVMFDFANRECQKDFFDTMNATNQVTAQLQEFLLSDKINY